MPTRTQYLAKYPPAVIDLMIANGDLTPEPEPAPADPPPVWQQHADALFAFDGQWIQLVTATGGRLALYEAEGNPAQAYQNLADTAAHQFKACYQYGYQYGRDDGLRFALAQLNGCTKNQDKLKAAIERIRNHRMSTV